MPTIVLASPKGGAGKTTSALTLATRLALHTPVTVIDADPQHYIQTWSEGQTLPDTLSIVAENDEDNIVEAIEEAAERTPFVIVDLEGTASKMVLLAVSQADLVLIPMQPSPMDAQMAAKTLRVVYQQEKLSGRAVKHAVFLTKHKAEQFASRGQKALMASLRERNVPVLTTGLPELEAYRAQVGFGVPLEKLDPKEVSNIPKAIEYAENFAAEVIEVLRAKEPKTARRRAAK
jgi:chromosome partitioning protein